MIPIVIIEDDPMVMEVNKQFAARVPGFEVVGEAGTGVEGIELVRRAGDCLVLLDVFLPDMDGIDVLKRLRQMELPADVILLTAARDSRHVQDGFRYGAADYLIKPFRFERFQEALEKVKQRRKRIKSVDKFNQEELDNWKGTSSSVGSPIPLPKGLNEWTLTQIIQYLRSCDTLQSAEDVAEGTGLARVTVRRYLEYLVRSGEVELHVQYGSVGRPMNRYRWR